MEKLIKSELIKFLKERKLELREHFFRNIVDHYDPKKKHVCAGGTGCGKTILTAAKFDVYYKLGLIKEDERVVILAGDQRILRQNFEEQFKEYNPKNFTFRTIKNKKDLQDAIEDNIQVLIIIPQTLIRHYKLLKNVKWLVIDEAHKWYFENTIQTIINKLKPDYQFLLTGTPFKFNLKKNNFIIDYTTVREMYEQGYVSDLNMHVLHSSVDLKRIDYTKLLGNLRENKKISKNDTNDSFIDVMKQLIKILKLPNKNWSSFNNISKNILSIFGKLDKTIIHTNGTHEADCMYEIFTKYNVPCLISHSNLKKEKPEDTFDKFKNDNKYKILITVDRGKEGFNFENLYNTIDFTYSQDFTVVLQMIGRLLRLSDKVKKKNFFKVAPRNTSLFFSDWMDCLIQLFDRHEYERYNTKNARTIRVPNQLLETKRKRVNTTNRKKKDKKFVPINLNELNMRSLSFMKKNKWFRSSDTLSVQSSTSMGDIVSDYYGMAKYSIYDETIFSIDQLKDYFNDDHIEYGDVYRSAESLSIITGISVHNIIQKCKEVGIKYPGLYGKSKDRYNIKYWPDEMNRDYLWGRGWNSYDDPNYKEYVKNGGELPTAFRTWPNGNSRFFNKRLQNQDNKISEIAKLWKVGKSYTQISKLVEIPKTTIAKIIQKNKFKSDVSMKQKMKNRIIPGRTAIEVNIKTINKEIQNNQCSNVRQYKKLARKKNLPSYQTILRRFGNVLKFFK